MDIETKNKFRHLFEKLAIENNLTNKGAIERNEEHPDRYQDDSMNDCFKVFLLACETLLIKAENEHDQCKIDGQKNLETVHNVGQALLHLIQKNEELEKKCLDLQIKLDETEATPWSDTCTYCGSVEPVEYIGSLLGKHYHLCGKHAEGFKAKQFFDQLLSYECDENTIDKKFIFKAVNPVNGHTYTQENAIILCAKDAAVPVAIKAYQDECVRLGANKEHIESIGLTLDRINKFQQTVERRVPDTVGDEIDRCCDGAVE